MTKAAEAPTVVADLMTVDLTALIPTDRVGRARDLQIALGIHALPVMDGNDVIGIVTSSDLIDEWPDDDPVTSIMTPTPTMIEAEASVQEAAELMVAERIHHLMVTDETGVIGILSSFDLLSALIPPRRSTA
ncbi:MAG: HPP family protein [Acidimicrobiales bacterium]